MDFEYDFFMKLTKTKEGGLLMVVKILLWSFFPIVSILSYEYIDPLFTAGIATLFATLFFALILTKNKKWSDFWIKEGWKPILISTSIIGIFSYSVYFYGLQFTTAGNASIVFLSEVFFSFLIQSINQLCCML